MCKWAHRDHLRHFIKTKAVTCNTSFASHFLSLKCLNFKRFPNKFEDQPTINNETYDVATDKHVIKQTTILSKKAKVLRILTGYVCSDFKT